MFFFFYILEPGPPSEVNVYAFAKYILVTWQPPLEPNGIITGYRVGSATYIGSEPTDVVVDKQEVGQDVRRKLLDDRKPEENYVVEIQAATSIGWGTLVKKTTTTVAWAGKLVNCNTPRIDCEHFLFFFGIVKQKECVSERENGLPRGKAAHHARVLFRRGRRLLLLLSCYFRSTILE